MAEEKARTTETGRISQARSKGIQKLKEVEKSLQAKIDQHEEAAKTQRQRAEKQSTQVQGLRKS